ncbi:MAG: PepSY domain-containing protein [Nitrospirota bacterium]
MKRIMTAAALVIGMALLTSGPAWSDAKGKKKEDEGKEKVEMATAAKVTIDQAIKTASEKVAGKVIEAELEKKHDKAVWEVEVLTADGKVMEVHIDADSGAVIDTEEKKAEGEHERKRERKGKHK